MKVKQVNLCYPQSNKTVPISFNLWTVCIFELWLTGHQKFRENDIQRPCWKCWCQEQTEITGPVNVACENSWKIKGKRHHTTPITQKMSKASPVFQFYNVSVTVCEAGGADTGKDTGLNWNKERVFIWLVTRDTHETVKTVKNKEAMTTMSLNYDI